MLDVICERTGQGAYVLKGSICLIQPDLCDNRRRLQEKNTSYAVLPHHKC